MGRGRVGRVRKGLVETCHKENNFWHTVIECEGEYVSRGREVMPEQSNRRG